MRKKKLSKYIIVSAESPTFMEMEVNKFEDIGYRACGGLSIIPDWLRQGYLFYQAMELLEEK